MSKSPVNVPKIENMVASRPFSSTWCDGPATTWEYRHPSDCRPHAKRVHVMWWANNKKTEIRVMEGDGRTDEFKLHARKLVRNKAGEEEIASVVQEFVRTHFQNVEVDPDSEPQRQAAGILTRAGFREDDWNDGIAWLMPTETEGFNWYVRGEGEVHFAAVRGEEIAVSIPGEIHPDHPCEVGIISDEDGGSCLVVVTSLDIAIRVVEERLLPFPSIDETRIFAPEDLFGGLRP